MEKNRKSAQESRKRKKHYMSTIEEKNKALEKENSRLQRRLQQLEDQNRLKNLSQFGTID